MVPAISEEGVISPYKELMAYEYLYAVEGTSRSKVSNLIQRNGGFPSTAADAIDGIVPDEEKRSEVIRYVKGRLGTFSVLVDGTPQFPHGLRAQKNPLPVFYYRGDINLTQSMHFCRWHSSSKRTRQTRCSAHSLCTRPA